MQISFFEEFPTKENLEKIKYVSFPTKLYLAAKSLSQFEKINISSPLVKEKIYWPILEKKEGYWFSPFSQRKALLRTIAELKNSNVPILWDAELPTHTNPSLYLTQGLNFFKNRNTIKNFIRQRKNISTAEYFPSSNFSKNLLHFLGVSFSTNQHFPIKMMYSSMHDFGEQIMQREIQCAKSLYGKRLRLGLGTLAIGVKGNEPRISPQILKRDLHIAQKNNIDEVILFRLGGMNKEYSKIITPFVNT